jgi:hypothetical protein
MASTPIRAVNLARQLVAIRSAIPEARGKINRGQLNCVVPIEPTPASQTYSALIQYRHWKPPRVHIVEPTLALHSDATLLPHVYPGNELCLFYPGEWQHNMLLAATILPWTAEWLLHYEIWLATGEWTGGGCHPTRTHRTSRSRLRVRRPAAPTL